MARRRLLRDGQSQAPRPGHTSWPVVREIDRRHRPIGIGKTVFLHRLQDDIAAEKKVIVAQSLAVEKSRITASTLIAALFFDLSREKQP